jgi:hypothetical protein
MAELHTPDAILKQMDTTRFPDLEDVYCWTPAVRLTALRDAENWIVLIEVLQYNIMNPGHAAIAILLYGYGSALTGEPGLMDVLRPSSDGPGGPTFSSIPDQVNPTATDICWEGIPLSVTLNPADYGDAGVELSDPPNVLGHELLRWMARRYGNLLFAGDDWLRAHIRYPMPLFLRLNEWHHPDIFRGERPSESESFRLLADALATGDIARYAPTIAPNTHWSNWPESGSQ